MNTSIHRALASASLALLCALPAAQAAGKVDVRWLEPGNFSDAERSAIDRERVTQELGSYMQKLGSLLPDGQTLTLEVTDLDLAGELEPVGWRELRVLRGRADWPRMVLRFTLAAEGRTLKQGEARLSDMGYSFGPSPRHEALGYEKRMLKGWFKAEFGAR